MNVTNVRPRDFQQESCAICDVVAFILNSGIIITPFWCSYNYIDDQVIDCKFCIAIVY